MCVCVCVKIDRYIVERESEGGKETLFLFLSFIYSNESKSL